MPIYPFLITLVGTILAGVDLGGRRIIKKKKNKEVGSAVVWTFCFLLIFTVIFGITHFAG